MNKISDGMRARLALEKNGFRFQHTLGQNFLLNDQLVESIVDCAQISDADDVLEIGPGAGLMTVILSRRAKSVTALEIDRALEPVLAEMLEGRENARVIFADAMKTDLSTVMPGRFAVVANLPYYITADMVTRLLTSGLDISSITIMVQKEAAERMTAGVGSSQYCLLAATIAYYAQCEIVMEVPPSAFIPAPHVDSALLRIVPYAEKPVHTEDEKLFMKVLTAAFAMRRKTLANNISRAFAVPRDSVLAWFEKAGIDEKVRGEAVEIADLARLADEIWRTRAGM